MLLRIRDEIDGLYLPAVSCVQPLRLLRDGHQWKIDLACRTQVATFGTDTIILEPLPNFEIIKDLVVDMTPFWQMYEKIQPYLLRKSPAPEKEIHQTKKIERKLISCQLHPLRLLLRRLPCSE